MSYLWMIDSDFREIALDRESRIPDEPYSALDERDQRAVSPPGAVLGTRAAAAALKAESRSSSTDPSCTEGSPSAGRSVEHGAKPAADAPLPSVEDAGRRGQPTTGRRGPPSYPSAPGPLFDDGEEPPHAATKDPRPDPRTHSEYWTE
jgi:hypothetical protein